MAAAANDIARILLPLSGASADRAAILLGLSLARRFEARLQALHVGTDSRDVAPLSGEGLSGAMVKDMMAGAERESIERQARVAALFETALAEDAAITGKPPVAVASGPVAAGGGAFAAYRSMIGQDAERIAYAARLSDLIVVPHPDVDDAVSSSEALHAVLFESSRPVIIAPKQRPDSIGERVCIGWNGTAQSAAAVASVLDWLKQAHAVQVLHSPDYQRRGPEVAALVDYLADHGIAATSQSFTAIDGDVGAGLLAAATAFDADLLSMGAYSHSRLRQLILGGVTRHVIENATLPVLMAH